MQGLLQHVVRRGLSSGMLMEGVGRERWPNVLKSCSLKYVEQKLLQSTCTFSHFDKNGHHTGVWCTALSKLLLYHFEPAILIAMFYFAFSIISFLMIYLFLTFSLQTTFFDVSHLTFLLFVIQGRNIVVFYGSQTGTAEEFAARLAKEANRFGLKAMVADPEECEMVSFFFSLPALMMPRRAECLGIIFLETKSARRPSAFIYFDEVFLLL